MKIKKALIPLALTALLAFGAAPVLAGDIISPATTGTADLRAQVDATYTVVIPASMTEDKSLKGGTNTIGALSATSLNLEPGNPGLQRPFRHRPSRQNHHPGRERQR